jgi:hypothetical protein
MMMIAMIPGTMKFLLQILVEPDPDPPLHRGADLLHPLAVEKLAEELPVVGFDEAGDVRPGYPGEVGIAPVEDDLDGGLPVRPEIGGPAGRNDNGEHRPAVIKRLGHRCGVREVGGKPKVGGGAEPADEIAAQAGSPVDDDRLDVPTSRPAAEGG